MDLLTKAEFLCCLLDRRWISVKLMLVVIF